MEQAQQVMDGLRGAILASSDSGHIHLRFYGLKGGALLGSTRPQQPARGAQHERVGGLTPRAAESAPVPAAQASRQQRGVPAGGRGQPRALPQPHRAAAPAAALAPTPASGPRQHAAKRPFSECDLVAAARGNGRPADNQLPQQQQRQLPPPQQQRPRQQQQPAAAGHPAQQQRPRQQPTSAAAAPNFTAGASYSASPSGSSRQPSGHVAHAPLPAYGPYAQPLPPQQQVYSGYPQYGGNEPRPAQHPYSSHQHIPSARAQQASYGKADRSLLCDIMAAYLKARRPQVSRCGRASSSISTCNRIQARLSLVFP